MSKIVSFVISTKGNNWEMLTRAILSILSASQADLEIIIIDQNNNEDFKLRLDENGYFGNQVIYFKTNKVGLSKGRNQGVKFCSGEWVVFFDDDAVLLSESIEKIKNVLWQTREEVVVYYGNVLNLENDKNYLRRSVANRDLDILHFDGICSIGMIFNRRVVERVGNFDEMFGVGGRYGAGEESDYLIRILDSDIKIKYLKDFTVRHPVSSMDIGKAKNYGYGLGAMYAKQMNFTNHFILVFKFLFEIFGRLSLCIFYSFKKDNNRAIFHKCYVENFLKGYYQYVSS